MALDYSDLKFGAPCKLISSRFHKNKRMRVFFFFELNHIEQGFIEMSTDKFCAVKSSCQDEYFKGSKFEVPLWWGLETTEDV